MGMDLVKVVDAERIAWRPVFSFGALTATTLDPTNNTSAQSAKGREGERKKERERDTK